MLHRRARSGPARSAERPRRATREPVRRAAAHPTPDLRRTFGNRAYGFLQAKLRIGSPNDPYEREADRAADAVLAMRDVAGVMTTAEARPGGSIQRKCTSCEEDEGLQRKPLAATFTPRLQRHSVPVHGSGAYRGGGRPLPAAERAFFEPRFGSDFSRVRVHDDARAADSARALDASAYTVGHDIAFAAGLYRPGTTEGRRLLAHELTHVVQQGSGDVIRRQTGAGSAPSASAAGPTNFCVPYATAAEAASAESNLRVFFNTVYAAWYGSEARDLWLDYLSGTPSTTRTRTVFSSASSEIVQGFVDSDTTKERQQQLLGMVEARLPLTCPTVPPTVWTNVPLASLVPASDLRYPINFDKVLEIPGNLAGGVSGSAFGADSRVVSGDVKFYRATNSAGQTTSVRIKSDFHFVVEDALDFCPGGAGAGMEQAVTVPLSRLEASGRAFDVPYKVEYDGPPVDRYISRRVFSRCWTPAPAPAPAPPIQYCFGGDTPVTLADGTTRPIREIPPGTMVLAFDEEGARLMACEVLERHAHPPSPLLALQLPGGRALGVTPNHPVLSHGEWRAAGALKAGDRVTVLADHGAALSSVKLISIDSSAAWEPVFDLTVGACHTFFAAGVLVHNKNV